MQTPATDKLKVSEVASLTGLSKASVLREIDAGEFTAFRVGPSRTHIRVTRASVDAYLARCAITPAAA